MTDDELRDNVAALSWDPLLDSPGRDPRDRRAPTGGDGTGPRDAGHQRTSAMIFRRSGTLPSARPGVTTPPLLLGLLAVTDGVAWLIIGTQPGARAPPYPAVGPEAGYGGYPEAGSASWLCQPVMTSLS
jgi:hypothetical protein